ncbi:MAG: putative glycosyltransferase EpsD [Verrucomicrobiales bacterium]|nr:putative glycosyltransferase EpsD [Verrucomicrobiales bacterium]
MRVTHVITRLIVGGAQENTIATVLGLAECGRPRPQQAELQTRIEANLITGPTTGPEGSLESAFKNQPHLLRTVPTLVRPVHPLKDRAALLELTNIFRATKPDIVHTHSGKAGVLGRLAAKRADVPIIIHTIHGPSFGSFQGALANLVFKQAERMAAKSTTHFITVANAMTEQYLAAGIGTRDQYTRIFSGFPLEPFLHAKRDEQLRQSLGIKPTDFVLGKIARLFELKGHDDLLDIAPELVKRVPNIKLLFVGNGAWRERLENKAQALGIADRAIFTGLIPPSEIPRHVGIMDALVHLSRREGLPRALPQALAAARPVIAYDCDGAREICIENQTGFLINPGDLATLTDRIVQLANDSQLRQRFGTRGQQFVAANFSVEHMVNQIADLYVRLTLQTKQ